MLSLADRLRLLAFDAALDQDRELWAALSRAADRATKAATSDASGT